MQPNGDHIHMIMTIFATLRNMLINKFATHLSKNHHERCLLNKIPSKNLRLYYSTIYVVVCEK